MLPILFCLLTLLLGQRILALPGQDDSLAQPKQSSHQSTAKRKASPITSQRPKRPSLQRSDYNADGSVDHLLESLLSQTHSEEPVSLSPHRDERLQPPEQHDEFEKWMESVFQRHPSNGPSSVNDHPHVSTTTASSILSQPTTLHPSAHVAARRILWPDKNPRKWNSPYSDTEQARIRSGADQMLLRARGRTTMQLRNELIRSLTKEQRNHLADGGSIETLPGKVAKGPLDHVNRWSDGLTKKDAAEVRDFGRHRLFKGQKVSKTTQNSILSRLTREEINHIKSKNEVEKQKIVDRFGRLTGYRGKYAWFE